MSTPPDSHAPRFAHPMVNARNLYANSRMSEREIAQRVADRLKPIGFAMGRRNAAIVAKVGGIANEWADGMFGLTLGGRIGEVFDLDALLADYEAWLADAPRTLGLVEGELQYLADYDLADFADFCVIEDHKRPIVTLVRCGLLLGYPVDSTVALIRQRVGLSGGVA